MRDPARIDRIVEKLVRLWKRYPDLRLGQLIDNARVFGAMDETNTDPAPFYVECNIIERGLDRLLEMEAKP